MLVKTHDHVLTANDHWHAVRTRDSDHFIQSVAVFADIKLNVLDSLSRKELLRLATVVSSREAVNLDLLHSRLLRFVLLVCLPAFGVRFHVNFITSSATRHGSACLKSDAKSVLQRPPFEVLPSEPGTISGHIPENDLVAAIVSCRPETKSTKCIMLSRVERLGL
jgi:hypothetical protein